MASSATASPSVYGTPMYSGAGQLLVCLCPQEKPHRLLEWATLITGVLPSETHLYLGRHCTVIWMDSVCAKASTRNIDHSLSEYINSDGAVDQRWRPW
jgi:hypothetical protein